MENGEVIALLDITKCLYDAISRMEKAAEQGSAIAAAVEGVERQWGSDFSGWYSFFWECLFTADALMLITRCFIQRKMRS